jgi:uncharacterized membrane protein
LSGFSLFTVSYLWNAGTYLVDKSLMNWSSGAAISAALAFLVVFWLTYDAICRVFGFKKNGDAIVGGLLFVVICGASWLACHLFAGRAAFLLMGAMIATAMSANVFFWIIPGQRKVIAQMAAGEAVDPTHGKRAKQRSVHNTYFTLPVLFAMLSNHYSFTYTGDHNWLVLITMMLAGALIRQFFVMRHGYKLGRNKNPAPYAIVGVLIILGAIVAMRPVPPSATDSVANNAVNSAQTAQNPYTPVQQIFAQRCYMCHGADVQMKNVRLDSPERVQQHAQAIYQQVVVTKIMPMNNATQITDAERATIGAWFNDGAKVK